MPLSNGAWQRKAKKMEFVRYQLTDNKFDPTTKLAPGVAWAQFGDETLLYAEDADAIKTSLANQPDARALRPDARPLRAEQMHVVVQNGRMFQQENPQVPVLVDRGRYLLVELTQAQGRRLKNASPTCFGVFSLRRNQVVFGLHTPAAPVQRASSSGGARRRSPP